VVFSLVLKLADIDAGAGRDLHINVSGVTGATKLGNIVMKI